MSKWIESAHSEIHLYHDWKAIHFALLYSTASIDMGFDAYYFVQNFIPNKFSAPIMPCDSFIYSTFRWILCVCIFTLCIHFDTLWLSHSTHSLTHSVTRLLANSCYVKRNSLVIYKAPTFWAPHSQLQIAFHASINAVECVGASVLTCSWRGLTKYFCCFFYFLLLLKWIIHTQSLTSNVKLKSSEFLMTADISFVLRHFPRFVTGLLKNSNSFCSIVFKFDTVRFFVQKTTTICLK